MIRDTVVGTDVRHPSSHRSEIEINKNKAVNVERFLQSKAKLIESSRIFKTK